MLKLKFRTSEDPNAASAGFCQGSLEILGENGNVVVDQMMIVPTASHLMDTLSAWLDNAANYLDVGLVDRGDEIMFEKKGKEIFVSFQGRTLGSAPCAAFLEAIHEAADELNQDFVSKLPPQDPARKDYGLSLSSLKESVLSRESDFDRGSRNRERKSR